MHNIVGMCKNSFNMFVNIICAFKIIKIYKIEDFINIIDQNTIW